VAEKTATPEENAEQEIIAYAGEKGLILSAEAISLLKAREDAREIIDGIAAENLFFVDATAVENRIIKTKIRIEPEVVVCKSSFKPLAKEIDPIISEIGELNITGQSFSEGSVQDFVKLFQDKFYFLEKVLRGRQSISPRPINTVKELTANRDIDLIGMVREKWQSKSGNWAFRVEDLEAECVVIVPKDNTALSAEAEKIILDDVIAIKGKKSSSGLVIAQSVFLPELPIRQPKRAERAASIALVSDMHVGSRLFLENRFQKFIAWLKGCVESEKEKEIIGRIKYLVVAGDNVDGIGIYPNQATELTIKNIFEQYKEFERLIMQVPEYIEVVIIPGQHDAARWADPQPAIPAEFLPELSKLKNFHVLSSPGWIEIEGMKSLLYHGASLHDLYSVQGSLSQSRPQEAMIEMLKRRTLMASYGLKQPYAPERKDFMLIKELPDFYFGGDMHHSGFGSYRGTTVVNASTWQSQTEYQLKQGHIPTPGVVPVIELQTLNILEKIF
jgi:DNA polymerase II small subunit